MKLYHKKHIISGAPGTGKTTLINALGQKYPCMSEVSRKVIKREQKRGGEGMPWEDLERFATLVSEAFVKELDLHPKALFVDRSLLDLIAYLEVGGKPVPSFVERFPYHDTFYREVFFAPSWRHIYQEDEQRPQTFNYSLELEQALELCYAQKGFKLIKLPKDTVPIRVTFVEAFLNRYQ